MTNGYEPTVYRDQATGEFHVRVSLSVPIDASTVVTFATNQSIVAKVSSVDLV